METIANRARHMAAWSAVIALLLLVFAIPANAYGTDGKYLTTSGSSLETQDGEAPNAYDAVLYDVQGDYPGVYTTAVAPNESATIADAPTIHIPSISDATLAEAPTTESPAIICGSAVPWGPYGTGEENAREFTDVSPNRVAPYSYFKFGVLNQQGPDGQMLPKLSGFDGTYVIVRIDISKLFEGHDPETSYLHVSQDKNNALLVAVGMDARDAMKGPEGTDNTIKARDQWGNISFSNLFTVTDAQGTATGQQYQKKTASYKLSEMYDTDGKDTSTPYFDVILFSTASIVSGADAQKEGALNGDVELSFYVDDTPDYDRKTNWDPQSTSTTLPAECFAKFYNEDKAKEAGAKISRYKVMGSELALETMVENSDSTGTQTTYWSLSKSMQKPYYDQEIDKSAADAGCGRTITLMSEVPVVDEMELLGASATELKKRTLNVNSFDIQIANNTAPGEGQYTSGLALKNAWLKIADFSNTTGAELAIGNNATMTIDSGGKLIVDRTCQLEIEWDGATVAPPAEGQAAPAADVLNNGSLDLKAGGELQNDGVVTIEGTEGKPYQPDASGTAPESEKGHGELTICEGATFTNNGCFMPNGSLYVQGTLVNNGKFTDTIVSDDPDKGLFTYHCGIQATWKDDVTQSNIIFGGIYVGMDKEWNKTYKNGVLDNYGDIVLCPGELVNAATVKNRPGAHIYSCATDKAIVPIEPDPNNPTKVTDERYLGSPKGSFIYNEGTIDNQGSIRPAQVTVSTNGSLGEIVTPGNYDDLFCMNLIDGSKITGTGYIYKHDLKRATIELRRDSKKYDSVTYNGGPQVFDVVVIMGDRLYMGNNDFDVTYLDPNGNTIKKEEIVGAGTYQVVLKGKETFKDTAVKLLTVEPAELTSATLSATEYKYNNKVHKPTVKAVKAGNLNVASSGYTVAYSSKNPKNAGIYEVTVTGKGNYTGSVHNTFTIKKATNTLTAKGKSASVAKADVDKKAQTVKRSAAITVSKAKGTLSYTLQNVTKTKFKKYFSVNSKTGNITVKKGLAKGTYTLKIKVKAAGTTNYNSAVRTVSCNIKVV